MCTTTAANEKFRSGRSFFVGVDVVLLSLIEASLEFLLSATNVAGELWQLGAAEQNQKDHENDEEFLRLETCHT